MFGIGLYDGPALALVGELALLRIEKGVVLAAKFCAIETGLSFVWRSFEGGRFTVLASRKPDVVEACNAVVGIDRLLIAHESSGGGNGRTGSDLVRTVRELSGARDRNSAAKAA